MFRVIKAGRRYALEAAGALLLLGASVRLIRIYAPHVSDPVLHEGIVLLPLVPIALFGIAGLRLYGALDEMMRAQFLVCIAGGVWLSQLVGMAYRYMPDAGLPPLAPNAPTLIICIGFVAVVLGLRQSLSEMRNRK